MFTYSQLKTAARKIIAVNPMPVRYALDEAYAELFAAYELAEREANEERASIQERNHRGFRLTA